jgi:hypothetical protein
LSTEEEAMKISIKQLSKRKAELKKMMEENARALLQTEFDKFFEENPECVALRWSQYTPYFNDGDTCTFAVHELNLKMSDSKEDAGDYEDGFEDTYAYGDEEARKEKNPFKKAANGVKELGRIDDDLFLFAFGDHCEVTATRDGFEVDEFSHD